MTLDIFRPLEEIAARNLLSKRNPIAVLFPHVEAWRFRLDFTISKGCPMYLAYRAALLATVAASAVLALGGCGGKDEASLMASARSHLAAGQPRPAMLELSTVLQTAPNLAEARLLLGRAFLDLSDPKSAAIEFQKARAAGHADERVLPLLAQALLQQQQHQQVIDLLRTVRFPDAAVNADLLAALGTAHLRLNQIVPAQAALDAALQAVPTHAAAQLERARLLAQRGDVNRAFEIVNGLVSGGDGKQAALQLRGDLNHGLKRDDDAALADYRQVLVIDPKALLANVSVITIEINAGRLDAAAAQLAKFKEALPNHPQVAYTEALVALARKDIARAREIAVQLLAKFDQTPPLLLLAGTAYLRGNELPEAEGVLTKALTLEPGSAAARYLLAQTHTRLGQHDKAMRALEPLLLGAAPSFDALALAGEIEITRGNFAEGEALLAKALLVKPGNAAVETAQAVSRLARGEALPALQSLDGIANRDRGITADMALIGARMRRGEFDKALSAIDQLEKKRPQDPGAYDLRGRVHLLRRDYAAARISFTKALELKPTYYPATVSLATLDIIGKNLADARQRFEAALKVNPRNADARLAVIAIAAKQRVPRDQIEERLRAAVAAEPGHVASRMALVGHLSTVGDLKRRLDAAQAAVSAIPNEPLLMEQLARAQADSGDHQQAVRTFNSLLTLRPQAISVYIGLADAKTVAGDRRGAVAALLRGLEVVPESPELRSGVVRLVRSGADAAPALSTASALQRRLPGAAAGYLLEGELLASQKKWPAAIAAFRKAVDARTGAQSAPARLFGTILAAGDAASAEAFAVGRLKSHPNDVDFRLFMGTRALLAGDAERADRLLSEAVRSDPANAEALNNLAWLRAERKGSDAVALAERAVALQPGRTAYLDTLAKALASQGQVDEAARVLRQAIDAAPNLPNLKLELARLYVKAGKRSDALEQLDQLQAMGTRFPGQAEVAKLRASLKA